MSYRVGLLCLLLAFTACTNDDTSSQGTTPCGGRLECACTQPSDCASGLVCDPQSKKCAHDTYSPAVNCYTPCKQGAALQSGKYITCGVDGLLEGCLDGFVCHQGACEEQSTNTSRALADEQCNSDVQCPDFQQCVAGRCQSTCDDDRDCKEETQCHRHVCRTACSSNDTSCPANTQCELSNTAYGFCMPSVDALSTETSTPASSVDVFPTQFRLDNTTTSGRFVITNTGAYAASCVVRKIEHTEYNKVGPANITKNPMPWVNVTSTPISISPSEKAVVDISNTRNISYPRWHGVLNVDCGTSGNQRVTLDYSESPTGRWKGTMVFFANFRSDNLDAWKEKKSDLERIRYEDNIPNSFLKKWWLFKRSKLDGIKEWAAILQSTRNETWKNPELKRVCPGSDVACYPYESDSGFGVYSTSIAAKPIPTGSADLPFSMNLQETTNGLLVGRVNSYEALHYPGYPEATLSFAPGDSVCEGAQCIKSIESLRIDSTLGGRTLPSENDTLPCELSVPGFEYREIPYFPEGFARGIVYDENGRRFQRECVQTGTPYTGKKDANRELSKANPIPDGQPRRRILEAVDGALINQNTIFIIFKETLIGLWGDPNQKIESYGYILLEKENIDTYDATLFSAEPSQPQKRLQESIHQSTCKDSVVKSLTNDSRKTWAQVSSSPELLNNFTSTLVKGDPSRDIFSLENEIDRAFAYRSEFQNKRGISLGFSPDICSSISSDIKYCYDPRKIEVIEDRMDCAVVIATYHDDKIDSPEIRANLLNTLKNHFSYQETVSTDGKVSTKPGFEYLNAELSIMLGDDAYTQAFASRFDLARGIGQSFQGDLLENNGIRLSGLAGYELVFLYQSAQYYQRVIDRFTQSGTAINAIIQDPSLPQFISSASITSYFGRVIHSAQQKSKAWSEIASRYQALGRPDLARMVIERAYVGTYLESVLVSQMMQNIFVSQNVNVRNEITKSIEEAQRGFRSSLLHMHDDYAHISDRTLSFGFTPEYIPFIPLDNGQANAFQKILQSTRQKLASALRSEEKALADARTFDTSQASFEAELTQISQSYESNIAALCGTFVGTDGKTHIATAETSIYHPTLSERGDICGMVGNGGIHEAIMDVDIQSRTLDIAIAGMDRIFDEIAIEKNRVAQVCKLNQEIADYTYTYQNKIHTLNDDIRSAQRSKENLERIRSQVSLIAQTSVCSIGMSTSCISAVAAVATLQSLFVVTEPSLRGYEQEVDSKQSEIEKIQAVAGRWETEQKCTFAQIDSDARVKELLLGLKSAELDSMRSEQSVHLSMSKVIRAQNEAKRLIDALAEAKQMFINVQIARNDPNVRIYKNSAVLDAERTYELARREAYRLTRIYEYYTNQTYAFKEDLYLARMVANGDHHLQAYVDQLEEDFNVFEETYGRPSLRTKIISMRDDVFQVPYTSSTGKPLSHANRVDLFRRYLLDASRLNTQGYRVIPFAVRTADLSPLTRNHKIAYVESEILGTDVGDPVGHVYLRQAGTSAVRGFGDQFEYYLFPTLTAVLNPFFNGQRFFGNDIYRDERLRDRPLINTRWEMVLNDKDEPDNHDIVIESLADIRLYVTYQDFTEF